MYLKYVMSSVLLTLELSQICSGNLELGKELYIMTSYIIWTSINYESTLFPTSIRHSLNSNVMKVQNKAKQAQIHFHFNV